MAILHKGEAVGFETTRTVFVTSHKRGEIYCDTTKARLRDHSNTRR